MPGRVFLTMSPTDLGDLLQVDPAPIMSERPRLNIAPGQDVVAMTTQGLTRMRWGMIPVGRVNARGRPVMETIVNARAETVFSKSAFAGVGRAVMPVSGWYEWTGEARRKKAWCIRPKDRELLLFAAIADVWTAPGGTRLRQLATVTCEPSGDVRDIHHRMAVILEPEMVGTWLTAQPDEVARLAKPWPDGRLSVAPAVDVDLAQP